MWCIDSSRGDALFLVEVGKIISHSIVLLKTTPLPPTDRLHAAGNNLTGELPEELSFFSSLAVLDLASNQLNGTIPEELGKMNRLEVINLADNLLGGPLPFFSNLNRLVEVEFNGNAFSGSIPAGLCSRSPRLDILAADCVQGTTNPSVECPKECCTKCCNSDTGECFQLQNGTWFGT